MYFSKFPQTYYTLDNRSTIQTVTNILLRIVATDELKNNFGVYDEYDIQDGDTPEILAFKIYGDTNLHWVILHFNDILDPRFDWPLDSYNLGEFVTAKYPDIDGIHHYEDGNGNVVQANVILNSSSQFVSFSAGDAIINNTQNGVGFIVSKSSSSNVLITATQGGFRTSDQIRLASNTQIVANITSTTTITGIPVTNFIYEQDQNESKRKIKILKPDFIERVTKDFESKMLEING